MTARKRTPANRPISLACRLSFLQSLAPVLFPHALCIRLVCSRPVHHSRGHLHVPLTVGHGHLRNSLHAAWLPLLGVPRSCRLRACRTCISSESNTPGHHQSMSDSLIDSQFAPRDFICSQWTYAVRKPFPKKIW